MRWIEVVFFDGGVGPDRLHQFVLAEHGSGVLDQVRQRVKRLRGQRHRCAVTPQQETLWAIQPEIPELVYSR